MGLCIVCVCASLQTSLSHSDNDESSNEQLQSGQERADRQQTVRMEDIGDLEMDLESMMGGEGGAAGGERTGQGTVEALTNMEQSSLALQQMGLILSKRSIDVTGGGWVWS